MKRIAKAKRGLKTGFSVDAKRYFFTTDLKKVVGL